jgi:hypothetical protein
MPLTDIDYRVVFDKVRKDGNIERGVVVGFAILSDNRLRVTVRSKGKRKTVEIELDEKESGNARLVEALNHIRDEL